MFSCNFLRSEKRKREPSPEKRQRKWKRYFHVEEEDFDLSEPEEVGIVQEPEETTEAGIVQEPGETTEAGTVQEPEETTKTGRGSVQEPEETMDPMKIELIVSKVLSYLSLKDLKSARCINPKWNALALPFFSSKASVEINLSPTSSRTAGDFWNRVGVLPAKTLKIVKVDSRCQKLNRVLDTFGSQLKELSLDAEANPIDDEENGPFRKNYFLQISQQCPNLESLELKNLPESLIESGFPILMKALMVGACPSLKKLSIFSDGLYCGLDSQFLKDIFDFAPNLDYFECSVCDEDALDNILVALCYKASQPVGLRVLKFGDGMGTAVCQDHIQDLMALNLGFLEDLSIQLLGCDVDPTSFHLFLEKISTHLKCLTLGTSDCSDSDLGLTFPVMPKLQCLDLGPVLEVFNGRHKNLQSFVEYFPNLKTLRLTEGTLSPIRENVKTRL